MMKLLVINFSIPESFVSKVEEMEKLVDKDPMFIKAMEQADVRYKKRRKSARYRFLIAKYINEKKKEVLEKNGLAKDYDSEEEDI